MDAPKDLIDKWKKLDPTKFESWITGVEYVGEAILQAVKGGIGYIERYSKYINPKLVARMQGDLSDKFVGIIATDNGGDNFHSKESPAFERMPAIPCFSMWAFMPVPSYVPVSLYTFPHLRVSCILHRNCSHQSPYSSSRSKLPLGILCRNFY